MAPKWEGFQWVLTLLSSVNDVAGLLGKVFTNLPEPFKQRMPKLFGLTLDDEQIFNGVLGVLTLERQKAIGEFLFRCKDYERNRFINIVAGMEVSPGRAEERETKWDKDGKKTFERVRAGSNGLDRRQEFLEKFAEAIMDQKQFDNDYDKAYAYCVGGRMIISDPIGQKALRAFSESVGTFKRLVLMPFGVDSLEELAEKAWQKISAVATDIGSSTQTFEISARARMNASKARYDAMKAGRKK